MGINKHAKDDIVILKGRIFKIKVNQMPHELPFPRNDMYDMRYKKEGDDILLIYITCIIDDSKIQDYFNEIIGRPAFNKRIDAIISCTYHEEYTWLSDNESDDDASR